jgi:nucleotide-binding universal stress UspA family protein
MQKTQWPVTCITLPSQGISAFVAATNPMSDSLIAPRTDSASLGPAFQRILVPTDFSTGARRALEFARSIARDFQSKIFLLHVIPTEAFELSSPETSRQALALASEFAKKRLAQLAAEGELLGIEHEVIAAEGPAWPMISETIKAKQIDLVTVSTHGRRIGKRLVLGSVAEKIYRMADCPILTVPPQFEMQAAGEIVPNRLLFATNFKPHSERAAAIAHLFECRQSVRLTILHVVEDSGESALPSQNLVEEFILRRMRKVLPEGCFEECKPDFAVRFGKPAEEILAAADQLQAKLILLGLRTASRAVGHLPSPVAYAIVCQAACPVLTLHQ